MEELAALSLQQGYRLRNLEDLMLQGRTSHRTRDLRFRLEFLVLGTTLRRIGLLVLRTRVSAGFVDGTHFEFRVVTFFVACAR